MSTGPGPEFMRLTQYAHQEPSAQSRGEPQPPLELPYDPAQPLSALPDPAGLMLGDRPLREMIDQRETLRRYSKQPITLAELSYLLWCTQGVKGERPGATRRTVPSAGARHAFETIILAHRVDGLEPGAYRFLARAHGLLRLALPDDITERVTGACLNQSQVSECAAAFIWVAVPERMTWRYSARGYRYLLLDAGHVCQNLYLAAESIDCGVCAIAAYDDEALNGALALDGERQFVIYLGTVGKKP